MRIIAGRAKGRKLKCKKGLSVRPMTNRIKKSVFDIISEKIIEANILDLYAGSGSLGIEALSRGAKKVIFVEKDYSAVKFLKQNLINTKFKEDAKILVMHVSKSVNILANKDLKFDIIFCDPPYNIKEIKIKNILENIIKKNILDIDGILIYHHPKRIYFPYISEKLKLVKSIKVGESKVSFYQYLSQ